MHPNECRKILTDRDSQDTELTIVRSPHDQPASATVPINIFAIVSIHSDTNCSIIKAPSDDGHYSVASERVMAGVSDQ